MVVYYLFWYLTFLLVGWLKTMPRLARVAAMGAHVCTKWPTKAKVLKALADVFGTTIDFLVMGDTDSKAQQSLNDAELINQFKKVSALPTEEKTLVLKMITAYIRDFNTQQAYAM